VLTLFLAHYFKPKITTSLNTIH